MINVKEEKTTATTMRPPTSSDIMSTLEVMKSPSTTVVNLWIKSFNKWLDILASWKNEASLIGRLVALSTMGEEDGHRLLISLHISLNNLIDCEIKNLETEILDMQQNLDLLQRYVINTDVKVKEIKGKMQSLSEAYHRLKLRVFQELTKVYPVTIF
jgi:hypothetical protein